MYRFLFWFFFLHFGCNGKTSFNLECDIQINSEYVFFDHCYNGISISELIIKDSMIDLYPHEYTKKNAIELVETAPIKKNSNGLKIYFNRINQNFAWKYYPVIVGHLNDAYYVDLEYENIQKIKKLFKPNTWYLFDFFNPHFDVFVFCDNDEKIKFVKRNLNPNF